MTVAVTPEITAENFLEKIDENGKKVMQYILQIQKEPEKYVRKTEIMTNAPQKLTYGNIFTFLDNCEAAGIFDIAHKQNKKNKTGEDKENDYFKTESEPVYRIKPNIFGIIDKKIRTKK
ncbi:MAG: hypothetical protein KKB25_03845 [Nanoarchaeota archaeon]|nr:hypothetical protein [Nanoarchaeota archaeon]